jgi:glycosyltransferase involved in cell wall biosynthesis
MITIQILTKNNESTIFKTLDSLKLLPAEIIVADIGSTDKTIEICKQFGAKTFQVKFDYDFSDIRNKIVGNSINDWQLLIHPWEALAEGHETIIKALNSNSNYKLMILSNDLSIKELRLWRKSSSVRFERPVFENIEPNQGKILNAMIYAENSHLGYQFDILQRWKDKEPTSPEPDYYLACANLVFRKYDDFIRTAEHYLFLKNTSDESVLMTHYYLAIVYCYIRNNPKKAIENIIECIAVEPTMAEFWCLLGDIYLRLKEFNRAKDFYQNALIAGNKRQTDDSLPMELSKYDEYPNKMIKNLS